MGGNSAANPTAGVGGPLSEGQRRAVPPGGETAAGQDQGACATAARHTEGGAVYTPTPATAYALAGV